MSLEKRAKSYDASGYRLLMIAITISLIWHLFWLSSVRIVSGPAAKTPIKFSKVAFLGPILPSVSMEVRAAGRFKSLLERRYGKFCADALDNNDSLIAASDYLRYEIRGLFSEVDGKLSRLIADSVAAEKLEPDYPAE